MNSNGGLGSVVEKRYLLIQDTLEGGQLTATQHANGRDWWILVSKPYTQEFYRLLVTPNGVKSMGIQKIGKVAIAAVGLASFSPDGTKYAKYAALSSVLGSYISVFDFDRCTGLLSNHKLMEFEDNSGSISFSPNSKILYHFDRYRVYQYDLEAVDLSSTQNLVATTDSYLDTLVEFGDTLIYSP